MTTDDGFTRDTDTVDKALVMACSRRTMALQEQAKAQAAVEAAESQLLHAEQAKLMRERHVDLCDRQISGLLDEMGRSMTDAQMVAALARPLRTRVLSS